MSEERKTASEKAMEKDCMFLMIGEVIAQIIQPTVYKEGESPDLTCRGVKCAHYNAFNSRCGFSV